MFKEKESSYVVVDGVMYPPLTKMDRWLHRQQWLCRVGVHYFLPVGKLRGFAAELCMCGRCGYSTWWRGNTWELRIHLGYWRQAGLAIRSRNRESSKTTKDNGSGLFLPSNSQTV